MNRKMLSLVPAVLLFTGCATTKPNSPTSAVGRDDQMPELTRAKIHSVVVPDTIEGNKYIKSHRVYILDDAGSWSK
jgi:hypothetical protein